MLQALLQFHLEHSAIFNDFSEGIFILIYGIYLVSGESNIQVPKTCKSWEQPHKHRVPQARVGTVTLLLLILPLVTHSRRIQQFWSQKETTAPPESCGTETETNSSLMKAENSNTRLFSLIPYEETLILSARWCSYQHVNPAFHWQLAGVWKAKINWTLFVISHNKIWILRVKRKSFTNHGALLFLGILLSKIMGPYGKVFFIITNPLLKNLFHSSIFPKAFTRGNIPALLHYVWNDVNTISSAGIQVDTGFFLCSPCLPMRAST